MGQTVSQWRVGLAIAMVASFVASPATATGAEVSPLAPPEPVGSFGAPGTGLGQFGEVVNIATAPGGRSAIADLDPIRVHVFSPNGAFLFEVGAPGEGAGEFIEPIDVGFDSTGRVVVMDRHNRRVSIFENDGSYASQFVANDITFATALAVGPDDEIFVADCANERIVVYSSAGKPQRFIGPMLGDGKETIGCVAGIDVAANGQILIHGLQDTIHVINGDGTLFTKRSFGFTINFASFDSANRLFIGNALTGEVWVRTAKGDSLGVWQTEESPLDVAFGNQGRALLLLISGVDLFKFHKCDGHLATHVGTAGADNIVGTGIDDVIVALGGNDLIEAGNGADLVCGGGGSDEIHGQGGRDLIRGGNGADAISGGPDKDTIYAGVGPDVVRGAGGNDIIRGGGGNDELHGGDGADELRGGNGNDTINGGDGSDDMFGGPGSDDVCHGGPGGPNGNSAVGCETTTGVPNP